MIFIHWFHLAPDLIRDPDSEVIKLKFDNHQNPKKKHKLTIDKVHLGIKKPKKPRSEKSTENVNKSNALQTTVKTPGPHITPPSA